MVGLRYGRLVVESKCEKKSKATYWLCRCDCGKEVSVRGSFLRSGKTKSCGCLRNDLSSQRLTEANKSHGKSDTRLYSIWLDMRKRCQNPRHWAYERYGGRGISVCEEWSDFLVFYKWATDNGYNENLTLDRRENDGNYCPENCRWVSQKVQSRNKSNNVLYEYAGENLTLAEWAERYNLNYRTLRGRILNYGWSIEKALTTPPRKGGD